MNATITNPINLLLLILGTYLGIKLTFFLLINQSTKHHANRFLGMLVLAQAMPFLVGFLYRFELLAYVPHIIGIQALYHFLVGPLVYFYIRACTQKEFELRPILWLHFIPFLLDIIYNMPFFIQSSSEKLAYYQQFVQNGTLYSVPIWNAAKAIQAIFYFILSLRLIRKYRVHLTNTSSSIDKAFHRWLIFFSFIIVLPILVSIIFVSTAYSRIYTILVFLTGITIVFFSLDMATLFKPELFHTFPHQMLLPQSSEEQKQKYESSNLQDAQKEKYIEKLQAHIKSNKSYLASELSLAQLSGQVNIPAHYLSQVINEKLKCNFLDFINGYRVAEARQKLIDPNLRHYTIMAIAYEAGFNSKSTFYSVFKKQTGMTPSQYRKQAS